MSSNDNGTSAPAGRPPLDASGAERLSKQALAIPFVGRHDEMSSALDHLLAREEDKEAPPGRVLVVRGDSGTGKTFFTRELMRQLCAERPSGLFLYADIANDGYHSARAVASLLKLALVAGPMTGSSTISVPAGLSLQRFRQKARHRGLGRGFLRAAVHALGGAFGLGSAVDAALGRSENRNESEVEAELAAYLSWAAKRVPVVVAIDNVQFLNVNVRLGIESTLQLVDKNVALLVIDRTVDGASDLDPPIRCFADRCLELHLRCLTSDETAELVRGAIRGDDTTNSVIAGDIFTKTGGLAKDIEYCLRQYVLELGRGAGTGAIDGLISTIDRLPLIQREFLMVAALLAGGVKKDIARQAVSRLAAAHDDELDAALDELIARDYLRLDADTGDRLRPGHERVILAMRALADEDLHEDVRTSLVDALASELERPGADSEAYLLHCLVGLQTARELTRNIHYISRLVRAQHRQDQFSYLVALSEELYDILPLLPDYVVGDLLDAMQKSSAFERGLEVIDMLDAAEVSGAETRKLYRFRYLTQAYRYDEALAMTQELPDDDWAAVYRINALMALDRDDEAQYIANSRFDRCSSEAQAVLRRNTITLFDPETALRHLEEAIAYFEREGSDFRLATCETNRGLIHLHVGELGDALRCLERAASLMRRVASREIYQAQVNLGVRSALMHDYPAALDFFEAAALQVPRALLLDRVKIDMNRIVVECMDGRRDQRDAGRALVDCGNLIRGIQMPYLKRALQANLTAARDDATQPSLSPGRHVSLVVPSGRWTLTMSVHWRY